MIDCAHFYGNEEEIGEALRKCFEEGIVKREDIFVISNYGNFLLLLFFASDK